MSYFETGPIEHLCVLGGSDLTLEIAKVLMGKGLKCSVITSPRQGSARLALSDKTLVESLREFGVTYSEITNLHDVDSQKHALGKRGTLSVSVGAPWIFKEKDIEQIFHGKILNSHGTRLPMDRGGGTFSWMAMTQQRFGVAVLHLVDESIDTGPIVAFREFLYGPECRLPRDYMEAYVRENTKLIVEFVENSAKIGAKFPLLTQANYLSSSWPRLATDEHAWIDWNMQASELEPFICAFDDPYSGAMTFLDGKKVRLKSILRAPLEQQYHSFQYGLIFRTHPRWVCVAVAGGILVVEKVFAEDGTNIIDQLKVGMRFATPREILDKALVTRVGYDSRGRKDPINK